MSLHLTAIFAWHSVPKCFPNSACVSEGGCGAFVWVKACVYASDMEMGSQILQYFFRVYYHLPAASRTECKASLYFSTTQPCAIVLHTR